MTTLFQTITANLVGKPRFAVEDWKWVVVYENGNRISYKGYYKISNHGRVKSVGFKYKVRNVQRDGSIALRTIIKDKGFVPTPVASKYPTVSLSTKDKRHQIHVHRLVLFAFVGPCPKGMEARHLDDDPFNNRLENLVWGTHGDNMKDAYRNGKEVPYSVGECNGNVKLSLCDVREIRRLYPNGKSPTKLAQKYNVSVGTIWAVIKRRSWKEDHPGEGLCTDN